MRKKSVLHPNALVSDWKPQLLNVHKFWAPIKIIEKTSENYPMASRKGSFQLQTSFFLEIFSQFFLFICRFFYFIFSCLLFLDFCFLSLRCWSPSFLLSFGYINTILKNRDIITHTHKMAHTHTYTHRHTHRDIHTITNTHTHTLKYRHRHKGKSTHSLIHTLAQTHTHTYKLTHIHKKTICWSTRKTIYFEGIRFQKIMFHQISVSSTMLVFSIDFALY